MIYTPIHVHSYFSLLDGLSSPEQIVDRTIEIGSNSVAITDHGNISGAIKFLKQCNEKDIKPIIGCELYICYEPPTVQTQDNRPLSHLVILAKNDDGWKDLLEIIAECNKPEHFYYKPRIDLNGLKKYGQRGNLISFAGHLGSVLANCIMDQNKLLPNWIDRGQKCVNLLLDIFGKENFWLEAQLMDHINNPTQKIVTDAIRELSTKMNLPIVATPDAHYCTKDQAELQRILLCTNMHTTLDEANKPEFPLYSFFASDNYHIPTYDEMISYGHTKTELEETNKIAQICQGYSNILKSPQLPKFPCPEGYTDNQWLRQLCREGWKEKIQGKIPKDMIQVYGDRVKEELKVFEEANLASYFLIVRDIVNYVRSNGGILSPGRGSVSGCLTAFLLGITRVDSIKYNLIFSRFYNAARKSSLPDIDLDVPTNMRGQVIDYIKQKYGADRVGHIITFGKIKGRSALKDVFRVYGDLTFDEINSFSKEVPDEAKIADELQEAKDEGKESSIILWALENKKDKLKDYCYLDEDNNLQGPYANRFRQAIDLEGVNCIQSKHAGGIIIGTQSLNKIAPMIYDSKSKEQIIGLDMNDSEDVGLTKLDILGVNFLDKNLDIQAKLMEMNYKDVLKGKVVEIINE